MARSFNGSSDVIRADGAQVFSTTSQWSVAFWVKASAAATGDVYGEAQASTNNEYFALLTTTGAGSALQYSIRAGSTNDVIYGSQTVFDDSWHHVTVTGDGSQHITSYVDGVLDLSDHSYSAAPTLDSVAFGALARSGTNVYFFAGDIAEVANWTRELTAKEAELLATGAPASLLGPAHYWPLWGVDSPEPDIGNAGHVTGTLTGTSFARGAPVSSSLLVL